MLAHNLGHLNTLDGRLTIALRRLVLPPVYIVSKNAGLVAPGASQIGGVVAGAAGGCLVNGIVWLISLLLSLAGGGFGVMLLSPLWTPYWRLRDYEADQFAARLGQGANLIEYLKNHQVLDVPVPYIGPVQPYSELRIDHLMQGGEAVAQAERAEARFRFRALGAVVGGALVVLLAYLGVRAVYNQANYGVANTAWVLTNFCLSPGCRIEDLSDRGAQQGPSRFQLSFSGATYAISDLTGGNSVQGGSVSYIDEKTVLLHGTSRNGGMSDLLEGSSTIEKSGDKLTLRGEHGTFVFVKAANFQVSTPTPAAAAGEEPPQGLIGTWVRKDASSGASKITFSPDRQFNLDGSTGSYTVQGDFVTLVFSTSSKTPHSYLFHIQGKQLTLESNQGEGTLTFTRQP